MLNASAALDINGRDLEFKWFHSREISALQGTLSEIPEF